MAQGSDNPIPQACAIPYRLAAGRIEVCLVTSRRSGRWTFPKGFIEPDETAPEAALKEAHEEAGLRGRIAGAALGRYERNKDGVALSITCYLMQVDREERVWRESSIRQRQWLPLDAARGEVPAGQRAILAVVAKRLRHRGSQAG